MPGLPVTASFQGRFARPRAKLGEVPGVCYVGKIFGVDWVGGRFLRESGSDLICMWCFETCASVWLSMLQYRRYAIRADELEGEIRTESPDGFDHM